MTAEQQLGTVVVEMVLGGKKEAIASYSLCQKDIYRRNQTLPVTSADCCVKGSCCFVVSLPFLFGHMPEVCNLLSVTKVCGKSTTSGKSYAARPSWQYINISGK